MADFASAAPRVPLSSEQQGWLEAARAQLDAERIAALVTDLVNIPSPTGSEGAAAWCAVERMRAAGLDARYEEMTPQRGNAIGRLDGAGGGASLLLYGHFDHYISGAPDDPLVVGGLDHPSFHSAASREGNVISGAGSGNPKGGCAAAIHAAEAVAKAGVPLRGDLLLGLVSGGIHKVELQGAGRPYAGVAYQGMGAGCEHMLRNGLRADFCISTKPGYQVLWEEPGVAWIRLTLTGVVGYAARRGAFKRPIEDAAAVIPELVDWFEAYADAHSAGQASTPGHIGAIEAGWPYKPDFSPSVCNLYIDLRVSPNDTVDAALAEFGAFVESLRARHPQIEAAWDAFASMPGTATSEDNWIVQSAVRAWEAVEGRRHEWRPASGMTDAAVLRSWGIPTARLGGQNSAPRDPSLGFLAGEGADLDNLLRVARCYVYAIIDTCARSRAEVGLA